MNNWKDTPCSWAGRPIIKMARFSKNWSEYNPYQTSSCLISVCGWVHTKTDRVTLKFKWKCKGHRRAKTVLKKLNVSHVQNFLLLSSNSTQNNVVLASRKDPETNVIQPTVPERNPFICSQLILSWWRHPTISSSVIPFFSRLPSFPPSGSFPVSQFFALDGQSIGASASASILPMNIQDWFPLGWTGWISLQSKGVSRVFSNTTVQKHQFFSAQLSL